MKATEVAVTCDKCGHLDVMSKASFNMRKRSLGYVACPSCNQPMQWQVTRYGRSDSQKRSRSQEKRASKRYGMKQQVASGSKPHAKSDLRDQGKYRGEMKETIKKSYSLKLETMMKLEKEADTGELPFLEIEFQGTHPFRRYVVLPEWAFASLKERSE